MSSAHTKANINLPTVPYVVSTPALLAGLDLLERAALRLHDAAVDEGRDEQVRGGVPAEERRVAEGARNRERRGVRGGGDERGADLRPGGRASPDKSSPEIAFDRRTLYRISQENTGF